jgi:hypothetical protein
MLLKWISKRVSFKDATSLSGDKLPNIDPLLFPTIDRQLFNSKEIGHSGGKIKTSLEVIFLTILGIGILFALCGNPLKSHHNDNEQYFEKPSIKVRH